MSNLRKEFEKTVGRFSGGVHPKVFDYSINISLKYQYLYTATPKVACSTIKSILQKMELEDPDFFRDEFEDIHNRAFSPLLKPSQVGDFEKFINSTIFKFCFSRNPYSRLLSAYLDKICGNKPQKRQILLQLEKDPENLTQTITFEEFVNVICEQSISEMNPHWRNQYNQTFQQSIKYDFIGKIENFPEDLHFVLNKVNKNFKSYLTDERRHSQNSSSHLSDFYTTNLEKKVKIKFSKDFEFFGYDEDLRVI